MTGEGLLGTGEEKIRTEEGRVRTEEGRVRTAEVSAILSAAFSSSLLLKIKGG
jgi:hypothetical protein